MEFLILSWCLGKRSHLQDFVLPRKFSNNSEGRAQVSTSFSLQSQDLLDSFKTIALCRRSVVLPWERSNGLSQNWNKMRLNQRCSCLHWVWRGTLILSGENPSNFWELNYRAQIYDANQLTGKMVVILLRKEWISLFGRGSFQRYVVMLFTRFVRTSRNSLSHKTWSHSFFAQHLAIRWFFPYAENWRINLWNW